MTKALYTPLALLLTGGLFGIGVALADHHETADQTEPAQAAAQDAVDSEEGFTVLFDGTTTEHFRSYNGENFPERGWVIEDGTLHVIGGARGGDIVTRQQYSDFDLRWDWRVSPGANSGVMYRVAEGPGLGAPYRTGPEYQILDDAVHHDGGDGRTSTAALYAMIACNENKELAPVGEWNTARIVFHDNHVEHWLNGELVVEYEWGSDELAALIAGSKFRSWEGFAQQPTGHIAFQYHGDDVWFRNIRIRDLADQDAAGAE